MKATTEDAYRLALRWYPRRWRAEHADEVLGVLLDGAEAAGRSRPTPGEHLDLAAHGIRERVRGLGYAVPADVRDRAAALSLGSGAMVALVMIFTVEWAPGRAAPAWLQVFATFGPFASLAIVLYAAWIGGFILAMLGLVRASRATIALTIPLAIGVRVVSDAAGLGLRPSWTTVGLFILLALIAVLGRPAATQRGAGWLAITAVGALAVFAVPLAMNGGTPIFRDPIFLGHPYLLGWSPLIALAAAIVLQVIHQGHWAAAVLLAAIPWTAVGLFGGQDLDDLLTVLSTVLLFAVGFFAMVGLLRIFGVRVDIRRVPERSPSRTRLR